MSTAFPPDFQRHWTVSVYVTYQGKTALHPHRKKALWLPAGGHIEHHELPDDAAVREAEEETGLKVRLVDPIADSLPATPTPIVPVKLARPVGIQLVHFAERHEHIDIIYIAEPSEWDGESYPHLIDEFRWVDAAEAAALGAPADVVGWVQMVTKQLAAGRSETTR